jgi:hypothetical protein
MITISLCRFQGFNSGFKFAAFDNPPQCLKNENQFRRVSQVDPTVPGFSVYLRHLVPDMPHSRQGKAF